MRILSLLVTLLCALSASAQIQFHSGGHLQASGDPNALGATCTAVGRDYYIDISATPPGFWVCVTSGAPGVWEQVSGGSVGSGVLHLSGVGAPSAQCDVTGSDRYIDTAADTEWYCSDAGTDTWTLMAGGLGGGPLHLFGAGAPAIPCDNTGQDRYIDLLTDEEYYCFDSVTDTWVQLAGAGGTPLTVRDTTTTVGNVSEIVFTPDGTVTDSGGGTVTVDISGTGSGSPLTVAEQDAVPSVASVTEIRVPLDTLIDEGAGVVSIDLGPRNVVSIWDADEDGSSLSVTCNAADDPLPWCLYAGHVIYPDAVDDLNVMARIARDPTDRRVKSGDVVQLEEGTYVGAPCWQEGNAAHDYTAPYDPDQRNELTDTAARALCPIDEYGNPQHSLNFLDGTLVLRGRGSDPRLLSRDDIANGARLDKGTYLLFDTGPAVGSEPSELWNWFGATRDRYASITVGFGREGNVDQTHSGTSLGGLTDWLGQSVVTDSYLPASDLVGEICICDNAGLCGANFTQPIANMRPGDLFLIQSAAEYQLSGTPQSAEVLLRFNRENGPTGCSAGGVSVEFGWFHVADDLTDPDNRARIQMSPHAEVGFDLVNANVIHIPQSILGGLIRIENMTIGAMDPWREPAGLCPGSGAGAEPWAADIEFPGGTDCDTQQMIFVVHGGNVIVGPDVVVRNGGAFLTDLGAEPSSAYFRDMTFAHMSGAAVIDSAGFDRFERVRIQDSYFASDVFAGVSAKYANDLSVFRSSFLSLATLEGINSRSVWRNIYLQEVNWGRVFGLRGGAKFNLIENVVSRGRFGGFNGENRMIDFQCDADCDANRPIAYNTIRRLIDEAPQGEAAYDPPQLHERSAYIQYTLSDDTKADFIYDNIIEEIYEEAATGTVEDHRAVVVKNAPGGAPTVAMQQVLERNWHSKIFTNAGRVFGYQVGGDLDASIRPRVCGSYAYPGGVRTPATATFATGGSNGLCE